MPCTPRRLGIGPKPGVGRGEALSDIFPYGILDIVYLYLLLSIYMYTCLYVHLRIVMCVYICIFPKLGLANGVLTVLYTGP